MTAPKKTQNENKVGGKIFEELFAEFLKQKFNVTSEQLSQLLLQKEFKSNSIPLSILRTTKLSSLEAIVKFLRENKKVSYEKIGVYLSRRPKALASTYTVARRKMPQPFNVSIDDDVIRIPFAAFTNRLSILECICSYLKSQNNSYAKIARMLDRDQRTVWTVCKRAERKLGRKHGR
jgi:hypothetical protein